MTLHQSNCDGLSIWSIINAEDLSHFIASEARKTTENIDLASKSLNIIVKKVVPYIYTILSALF